MQRLVKKIGNICLVLLLICTLCGQAITVSFADEYPAMVVYYNAFLYNSGWSAVKHENLPCISVPGSYVTAIRISLQNQPVGISGTVAYQANLSGSGWLDWVENGADAGSLDTDMPLEAIRMKLTGDLELNYDIYYAVLQNGIWSEWAMNGADAGKEGVGLRVDGFRVSVVKKGAAAPSMKGVIDPALPMVALTFDDGPYSPVTNRILDFLESNGGRATFFMVGNRVSGTQAVLQRMTALGCQVGNHTYQHKYLTKLSDSGIRFQVSLTNQRVAEACGVTPTVVRPPGGFYNKTVSDTLGTMGMSAVMWSIDTRDWKIRNAQKTIEAVLNHVQDGDIILMHDLYPATADAVEVIIPELVRRGYQLVTVSELAEQRGGLVAGKVYNSFRP